MTARAAQQKTTVDASTLLTIDSEAEIERIATGLREQLRDIRKRGLVLGLSGGIDSSVSLALAVRAVGAKNDRTLGGRTDPVAGNLGQRGGRLESAVDMAFKGVGFHGSDRILGVDL